MDGIQHRLYFNLSNVNQLPTSPFFARSRLARLTARSNRAPPRSHHDRTSDHTSSRSLLTVGSRNCCRLVSPRRSDTTIPMVTMMLHTFSAAAHRASAAITRRHLATSSVRLGAYEYNAGASASLLRVCRSALITGKAAHNRTFALMAEDELKRRMGA